MFNYLNGIITELNPVFAVVDCNGVGYEVEIPISTYEKLKLNVKNKLFIHYYQNDEGVRLFGFFSIDEKNIFRKLISISRIGPKIAISMISALPVSTIINAIISDDYKLLAKIPGLGKKTAQRLILELKDKMSEFNLTSQKNDLNNINNEITEQAENALITLGYKQSDIRKTFSSIIKDEPSIEVEGLIKKTIKILYKKG